MPENIFGSKPITVWILRSTIHYLARDDEGAFHTVNKRRGLLFRSKAAAMSAAAQPWARGPKWAPVEMELDARRAYEIGFIDSPTSIA